MALLTGRVRLHLLVRVALAVAVLLPAAGTAGAQTAPAELEQQVKAAYLLNFTRYVEWPPGTFAGPDEPITICVFGADGFGDVVRRSVEGRRSRGRPVRVLEPDTPAQAGECHVAFLSGPRPIIEEWVAAVRGRPTLTVGDGTAFLDRGGIISFVLVSETIRFEIDQAAAQRARLRISSRVLSLATRLHGETGAP